MLSAAPSLSLQSSGVLGKDSGEGQPPQSPAFPLLPQILPYEVNIRRGTRPVLRPSQQLGTDSSSCSETISLLYIRAGRGGTERLSGLSKSHS